MNIEFPQTNSQFILPGPAGNLEVMTTFSKDSSKNIVGVICHPHPLFEGSMQNKVVTTIAKAFDHLGFATVRFNFRGVGKSEGQYGETIGETEDLLAVIKWVKQALPDYQMVLAGFSFGAYISAKVANQISVLQLVSIGPAVSKFNFKNFTHIDCPWLVIQGDQDEVVPFEMVKAFAENPPAPLKLIVMEGASHFFHGRLIELREILEKNVDI